jgi:hypothetical protein
MPARSRQASWEARTTAMATRARVHLRCQVTNVAASPSRTAGTGHPGYRMRSNTMTACTAVVHTAHTYTHIHTYMCVYVSVCVLHIYVCLCAYTCMCVCIHMHTHIYTETMPQTQPQPGQAACSLTFCACMCPGTWRCPSRAACQPYDDPTQPSHTRPPCLKSLIARARIGMPD